MGSHGCSYRFHLAEYFFQRKNSVYQIFGADQYPSFFYLTIKKMGQQIKKRIKIRQTRFVWHREEPVFFDLDFFDQVIVKKGLNS
jgi:hypothetical protein